MNEIKITREQAVSICVNYIAAWNEGIQADDAALFSAIMLEWPDLIDLYPVCFYGLGTTQNTGYVVVLCRDSKLSVINICYFEAASKQAACEMANDYWGKQNILLPGDRLFAEPVCDLKDGWQFVDVHYYNAYLNANGGR